MNKGFISAAIAVLFAAGAGIFTAAAGGFTADDAIHWKDTLADHDSFAHCADWVFALVLAAVSYWRGLSDA